MKHSVDEAWPSATLAVILFFGIFSPKQSLAVPSGSETNSAFLFKELITLDPRFGTNLTALAQLANSAAKNDKKESKAEKKLARDSDDLKNLPTAELQKRFIDGSPKHETRTFSAIGRLASEALQADDAK